MWDFSWLERRWPGAGYEDWDRALDELAERGYNAVRIDAYPHLLAVDPLREWEILPTWNFLDWGAPCRVVIGDIGSSLVVFIGKCRQRGIKVGLSTWFREDRHNVRLHIASARAHAYVWIKTLDLLKTAGLLDALLYVDLCNEWPGPRWAPFFKNEGGPAMEWNGNTPTSHAWMQTATLALREAHPGIPLTFSYCPERQGPLDFTFLDFFEPHIWLSSERGFYEQIGYKYQVDISGLEIVALHAEKLYRADPTYWLDGLREAINRHADFSRDTGRLLMTTECWALVDYRDWPLLDWGYIKEICVEGVHHAAATGRWAALATSNFCGPQFVGMWRDLAWHRQLTSAIAAAPLENIPLLGAVTA